MEILNRNRLERAKNAFSTRRVPVEAMNTLLCGDRAPKAGDLVLARVTNIGFHKRIELPTGRRATLAIDDEIILAYGNRYAPDQYEAHVPADLSPCHMVAAGGIAGQATSWHGKLSSPTAIEPIGLLGGVDGTPLNLVDFALPQPVHAPPQFIFAVFGTSMNAGKTTTAAGLVKGFTNAGYRVGAAKITGTGAGGDLWLMHDHGACEALDFTDAGMATTAGASVEDVLGGTRRLLSALGEARCTVAVIEVADGLYQCETAALAESAHFRALLSGTFFAAGDAMGAVSGAAHLHELGHNVLGISGALTSSPLAQREAGKVACAPVRTLDEIIDPEMAASLLQGCSLPRASGA